MRGPRRLLRPGPFSGQGQEDRSDPDRVHDHEEGQERAQGELGHVLGVLLAALAVQYVADGVRGLLRAG